MEVPKDFVATLLKYGIISYDEQETLWQIAKRCARVGVAAGSGLALLGTKAGTVVIPGIGTVSGAAAGFLGGLVTVGGSCVALNKAYASEFRKMIEEYRKLETM